MRRVLLITPHFPPDASSAGHRVRLLAPYLGRYGWEPIVLTCREDAYEGHLDPGLPAFVPCDLRVVRAPAWPARLTRLAGVGDLGVRSFTGLWHEAVRLFRRERIDALFITIFPSYTALLGPLLVRRFGVPFVLDYQDPWVNAWGVDIGGGAGGTVDFKSRLSRWLAEWLEPSAVRAAAAITGVSPGTYQPVLERHPDRPLITEAIPLGAEPRDFAQPLPAGVAMPFDAEDGLLHICYTGTIAPLGFETLRAFLEAVARIRDDRPALYARIRIHFIGTSNQTTGHATPCVLPMARAIGVDGVVDEQPSRLPYSTIVHVQRRATILVALGSTEPHYTASKIFPLLLAQRPILAVYHEGSTVNEILAGVGPASSVACVTYSDRQRAGTLVDRLFAELVRLTDQVDARRIELPNLDRLHPYWAATLAGRLAHVLDRVVTEAKAA